MPLWSNCSSSVGIELRRVCCRVRWRVHGFRHGPQSTAPVPTFPQAPLRSRTVGFPKSGSDLGMSSGGLPNLGVVDVLTHLRPCPGWFTDRLVPHRGCSRLPSSPRAKPPSAQSPFA